MALEWCGRSLSTRWSSLSPRSVRLSKARRKSCSPAMEATAWLRNNFGFQPDLTVLRTTSSQLGSIPDDWRDSAMLLESIGRWYSGGIRPSMKNPDSLVG